MPEFEKDVIMRQVRQLGDLVAVVMGRSRVRQECESGLEAIRESAAVGFGPDRSLIDRLDPASAVMVLREPEAVRVYAQVCTAEAALLERLDRAGEAAVLRARAAGVAAAARASGGSGDP